MRTSSYQTLLAAFCNAARERLSTLAAATQETMTGDLNESALWLWETECANNVMSEDMLTGKTVTLGTGGVIAAADIESAHFWSVWQSDPREAAENERARLRLGATALANGDVKVINGTAASSVYVIYKTQVPQWTVTAPSNSTPYKAGDLVLCDGHVYRALIDDASAADLSDTSTWVEVTLPQSLQRIVVLKANSDRLRLGANLPVAASREDDQLQQATDMAWISVEAQPGNKPWLQNQNV